MGSLPGVINKVLSAMFGSHFLKKSYPFRVRPSAIQASPNPRSLWRVFVGRHAQHEALPRNYWYPRRSQWEPCRQRVPVLGRMTSKLPWQAPRVPRLVLPGCPPLPSKNAAVKVPHRGHHESLPEMQSLKLLSFCLSSRSSSTAVNWRGVKRCSV